MTRIKITKDQYKSLMLHECIHYSDNTVLNETLEHNLELLEEGWREVVLGVAMMLGLNLSGQNKAMAQHSVKDAKTMAQIKNTLEDANKTKELVDLLKEKGMKDPEGVLSKNAEKVIDNFNKIAKDDKLQYTIDVKGVNNLQSLNKALGQGYALTGVDSTEKANTNVNQKNNNNVSVKDTMDVTLGSDNMFVTGGYTLQQNGVDSITQSINAIKEQGGKILSIEIESSTDAETIPKFKNQDDPTGNIKLANLRYQSIANLISSLNDKISITHREIPNNGSNVVNSNEFNQAENSPDLLNVLRDNTKQFRYAKIKIVAVFEGTSGSAKEPEGPEFIKTYRYNLVKAIVSLNKANKINASVNFKHKKFNCKRVKGNEKGSRCTTF